MYAPLKLVNNRFRVFDDVSNHTATLTVNTTPFTLTCNVSENGGRSVFHIERKFFSMSGRMLVSDVDKNLLFDIRKRFWHVHSTYDVVAPKEAIPKEAIPKEAIPKEAIRIKKSLLSRSGSAEVKIPQQRTLYCGRKKLSRKMDVTWKDHVITDKPRGEGEVFARFRGRDMIDVAANVDRALIVAVAMALRAGPITKRGAF